MSTPTLFCVLVYLICHFCDGAIDRPRGVQPSRASHYQPGPDNTFTCITTGEKIKFEFINDDYCDCSDGSDEPGTAACPDMTFFCQNKGHKSENILSSRVDDGICDCCDGSDEYTKDKIQCTNTCDEMGKIRREMMEKEKLQQEAGHNIRKEYVLQGAKERQETQALSEELDTSKETLVLVKQELEEKKLEAENPEKEAKEKHEKAWEDVKAGKLAVKEKQKAADAFMQLDVNMDGFVDASEMVTHIEFDIDSDGAVSEDESKEYLEDLEQANMIDFIEKIWPNIKEIYKVPVPEVEEAPADDTTPPPVTDELQPPSDPDQSPPPFENIPEGGAVEELDEEEEDNTFDDEDDDEEDDVDDRITFPPEEEKPDVDVEEEDKMPEYDEDTKKLIELADEARRLADEADQKVRDIDQQLNTAKAYLENDFGPDAEYSFLHKKCFEYTDREYTYKLCAFDKTTQRPKAGGSETNLGIWGHWDGPTDDKYAAQKYEKGQNCWNGPDRSVRIILLCGTENQLLSASEPSRCEYQFEFSTPARCSQPHVHEDHEHDEL